MRRIQTVLSSLFAALVAGTSAGAATLAPAPPQVTPFGDGALAPTSVLGVPGPFWAPVLDWSQTGEVLIALSVASPPGDPGDPVLHNLFVTNTNNTADDWHAFELEVSGPAVFTTPNPPTLNNPSDPPVLTPGTLEFTGTDWPSGGVTRTVAFSLNVSPPVSDEPVVLTLRPVAVPEPGTGVLVLLGVAAAIHRRRRA